MGFPYLSIDAGLNLIWAVLSLGVLLCWRAEWSRDSRRALVAILCALVLLFPVISMADDALGSARAYDVPSWSAFAADQKISNDFRSVTPIDGQLPRDVYSAEPLVQIVGEWVQILPGDTFAGLPGCACGIHSPPHC